ncbi:hypothetical protein [Pseudonocardia sp. KRD291]|uniref:hypothetical protein n=1 Tax=Pseudonocardia sp. KRD291 TaxID=2792007 RepID=UPI001C4A1773|nr:hypothetical protein [Pseudonocardia sp. KRD291]MBW0102218.1 hypothetical protein [Pseudonocardia sp. KRD291]
MNQDERAPHVMVHQWPDGAGRRIRVDRSGGWAAAVGALVRAAEPGAAGNRLVTVDGFSGAGKSTLAGHLARSLHAPLITLEEIYPGWDGLARTPALARRWIGDPLATGSMLRRRTWDWDRDAPGPWRSTDPAPVVVLEGCGAGARVLTPVTSLAVWVDTPAEQRERRLRAREDWTGYAPFRARWSTQEQALAAAERTAERADVVLDNSP